VAPDLLFWPWRSWRPWRWSGSGTSAAHARPAKRGCFRPRRPLRPPVRSSESGAGGV